LRPPVPAAVFSLVSSCFDVDALQKESSSVIRPPHRVLTAAAIVLSAVAFALALPGHAVALSTVGHPLAFSWWTLPQNFSSHGGQIDGLYYFIFALTTVTFFLVQITLVVFLVKYRYNPEKKKARFIHGNSRLELIWTIIPAIIMLSLALASKSVWDNYRYSPALDDPASAHVLIIARQFNWNAIYAGPDNTLGQYLVFPKPTDLAWPADAGGKPVKFAGVTGPAFLPHEDAVRAINQYTAQGKTDPQNNEFGKVFDPKASAAGADDIFNNPAGLLELPVNRFTVLEITSMDVIHDFYLPNFRVNVRARQPREGRSQTHQNQQGNGSGIEEVLQRRRSSRSHRCSRHQGSDSRYRRFRFARRRYQ
jgi:heme/copper-type cytochrome/quinol oxidase subunit 2